METTETQTPAPQEQTTETTDQETRFAQQTAERRTFQRDEAAHRAAMLAAFYGSLVALDVPSDDAINLTQSWLEQGMIL